MSNMLSAFNLSKNFSGNFDKIYYDSSQVSSLTLDIWTPVVIKISQEEKHMAKIFSTYKVKPTDFVIEIISNNLYGKASLWWTILLANNEDDPFDFLKNVLDEDDKYPNGVIKVFTNSAIIKLLSNKPKQFDLNETIRNKSK